jgi:hypothetical protein
VKLIDHNATVTHLSIWKNTVGIAGAQELALATARAGNIHSLNMEFALPSSKGEEVAKLGGMLRGS